jgi:osmotically-inducible protein OsmY
MKSNEDSQKNLRDTLEKKNIEKELARNWCIDHNNIAVKVSGSRATLNGIVNSWYQKDEAGRIASSTHGICSVENELQVEYHFELTY